MNYIKTKENKRQKHVQYSTYLNVKSISAATGTNSEKSMTPKKEEKRIKK